MNNENHPISQLKLKTFYNGMLKEHNMEEKGYLTDCIFPDFDPFKLIGNDISEGKIKEDEYRDGRKMYGCDFMGPGINFWDLLLMFDEKSLNPITFISDCSIQTFRRALKRPKLKWEDITYEVIEKIYEFGVSEGKDLDNLDPDYKKIWRFKKKNDFMPCFWRLCCSLETSLKHIYDIMLHSSKAEKELKEFALCYVSMGGVHSDKGDKGELMSYPDDFAALIQWFDDNITPSELPTMMSDEKKEKI